MILQVQSTMNKNEFVNFKSKPTIYTMFVLQLRGAFLRVITTSVVYEVTARTRIGWVR